MKNLSKLQFELLNLTHYISPFLYWKFIKISNPNLQFDGFMVFFSLFLFLVINGALASVSYTAKENNQEVNFRLVRFAFTLFFTLNGFVFIENAISLVKSDAILFRNILFTISISLAFLGNYSNRMRHESRHSGFEIFSSSLSLKLNRTLSKVITFGGIMGILINLASLFTSIDFLSATVWFMFSLIIVVFASSIYIIFSTPKSSRFKGNKTVLK